MMLHTTVKSMLYGSSLTLGQIPTHPTCTVKLLFNVRLECTIGGAISSGFAAFDPDVTNGVRFQRRYVLV